MELNRHDAAALVVKELQRRWGDQAVQVAARPRQVSTIPTGFQALDRLLSGIPRGHITQVQGNLTSGMTTLALRTAASAQAQGDPVVYIDLQYSFDPYYAAGCGVQPDSLVLVRPAFTISSLEIAYQIAAENAAGLLVINSTADILAAPGGNQALDATLRKLTPALRKSACSVMFLSPVNARSAALAHYATLQLHCERTAWLESPEDAVGFETQVTVVRNRLGRAGQTVKLRISLEPNEEAHEEAA